MSTNELLVPHDDGAADHLTGMRLPNVTLVDTDGNSVHFSELRGRWTIFVYPMTGKPGVPLPEGWDEIPGAKGCTPQSCGFRDHYAALQEVGSQVLGVSAQSSEEQREAKARLALPYALVSDATHQLKQTLRLPTFEAAGKELYKRMALLVEDQTIVHTIYPVFPPGENAEQALSWWAQAPRG
jgi:peroxiredoxin